ncbi:MAG: ABC transporter ATP-binding protein, partial [Clostridiales bacterium]|nr:ABC transporter ATP-binding protein [Clostridiales bacterium]
LTRLGYTDIDALDASEVYGIDLSGAPENASGVTEQTRVSIGAAVTQLFYRELGADLNTLQQRSIMKTGGMMIVITVIGMAFMLLNSFLSARVSTSVGRRLRCDEFKKVQTFSPSEFDKFSTATLITHCTNDVQHVQMIVMMSLRMVFSAPIMGIGGIIFAVRTSFGLSWIIAAAVILLLLTQLAIFTRVVPKFKVMQKLLDRLNLVSREALSGMLVIRAFGNEQRESERFDAANRDIYDTNKYVQRTMAFFPPSIQFILGLTPLAIILFGARAIDGATLQVGQMMAFIQYVMQIIQSFMIIGMIFVMIPRALVSAARISDVLACETSIADKPEQMRKTLGGKAKGDLRFNNVSFSYGDAEANVLDNISFTAKAGEVTAFIGSTGSGKSTLVNLIPRFYDVSSGDITLDGVDIRDLSVRELRENLGYVPQKGTLFSGDVASNLGFGKENATDDELREAIRVAQAENFVFFEKEGLETEIAQGGDNVSGGQKQRLSIARALVRKPAVYIFDDSFSALDFKTDAALRKALSGYTDNATVLIVAQRVSTIMTADRIIVLDEGRIVGSGTHSELLKSCGEYREIAESQLSKEELG